MEVILQKDYISLGYEGDICKVKPGYARNYLIPKQIAIPKTEAALKTLALMQKSIEKKRAKRKLDAVSLKEKINDISIDIKMKVADNNKLYGSVTQQTILDSLKEKGIEVNKRDIHLEKHIKELGVYTVEVKLYFDVVAEIKVTVADIDAEKKEVSTAAVEEVATEENASVVAGESNVEASSESTE